MTKDLWINLPVKDVKKAREFFTKIGFTHSTKHGNSADSAGMIIGNKNIVVMLFAEHIFKGFCMNDVSDTTKGSEILLSFDAESRDEVDEIARRAVEAGGILFGKPAEHQGWMYGCAFTDLDGHRWNVLYMDMAKMPKMN